MASMFTKLNYPGLRNNVRENLRRTHPIEHGSSRGRCKLPRRDGRLVEKYWGEFNIGNSSGCTSWKDTTGSFGHGFWTLLSLSSCPRCHASCLRCSNGTRRRNNLQRKIQTRHVVLKLYVIPIVFREQNSICLKWKKRWAHILHKLMTAFGKKRASSFCF